MKAGEGQREAFGAMNMLLEREAAQAFLLHVQCPSRFHSMKDPGWLRCKISAFAMMMSLCSAV